jgi:hypothetical protein
MKRTLFLCAILLAGWSPFLAEHPEVAEGNRRLETGDPEGALRSYERAEKQLGPRPEIDYDRGGALYRLGRFGEARETYRKALETPGLAPQGRRGGSTSSTGLAARDTYNLGNALARLDDVEGAIRAYRRALAIDPNNEDARYNLEVMLRRRSEGKRGPPPDEQGSQQAADGGASDTSSDPGSWDGGRDGGSREDEQDGGRDAGADAGRDAGAGPGDGGRDAGAPAERKRTEEAGGAGDGAEPQGARTGRDEMQGGGAQDARPPAQLSRQEAERLLDAMREREKNMPMRPVGERRGKEPDVAKDW